jgi:predicted CXXCH cytochrome family protein
VTFDLIQFAGLGDFTKKIGAERSSMTARESAACAFVKNPTAVSIFGTATCEYPLRTSTASSDAATSVLLHHREDVPNVTSGTASFGLLKIAKAISVLAVVAFFCSPSSFAKTHPVPLEKNTDSATCISCHGDKAKGKSVHSAIATGCTSCHEVRVNKDVTRVKLITSTPTALCFTCHAEKNPEQIKGKVHPPALRDCVKCHDPHTSEVKNQLLKPMTGDQKENLCLSCHTKGLNVPQGGSRHAALDMGCETCHVTHKAGDPEKQEFEYHLAKATPQLCLDCHDANDASLQKAHQGQPFGSANCVQCHDPHQSSSPKLMQAFLHNPFENKLCESCHQAPKDGKVVLTQADSKALCVSCHAEEAKKIDSAKVPHPGAQGDCVTCHNPHAGKTSGFVQPNPVNACLSCHADQAEQHKKKHLHQPAFEQGCATCHEPHGGENDHLLRAKNVNALCLECHGPDVEPKKLEKEHLVTIFDGKVKLPEDYFSKVFVLPLKYGVGHPTDRHPVSDTVDFKSKKAVPMTCLSCHQPHAGGANAMLVKDQEPNMAFCKNCHKEGTIQFSGQ